MKRYKIKHYRSRIYNPIRGKIIKGILIAVIVASLFAIGWFAYEPLMEAINEKNKEIIEEDPVPEKPAEPVFEPAPEEFLEKDIVAVTVPEEVLYSSIDYHAFIKSLDDEVNAVVIDMKTQNGTVTYRSSQISVINAGAAPENAVNLDARIKTAKDSGLDVIARIYAFEDSTAPYNAIDMAIRYESEDGILWLDDSVDNGGKPWLNPYSDTAQKYVLDIVFDAIDSEVDAILLDGIRFPENEGMEYAYFGIGAEEVSFGDILSRFAKRVYSSTVVTDTDLLIAFDSYETIAGTEVYGESALSLSADGYSPKIDIDDFIGEKFSDEFYFKRLPEDITEVFIKIYESIGNIGGLDILPVLDFEGFTKEQTKGIFDLLEEKNASGYILIYDEAYFTGIPEEPEIPEETPPVPETPSIPAVPSEPVTPSEPETPEDPENPENSENPEEASGEDEETEEDEEEDKLIVHGFE